MKLGRNDPCHCGSGRKYKRCHLDEDKRRERESPEGAQTLAIDTVAAFFGEVVHRTPDFAARVMAPADAVREKLLARIGDGLEGREAAEALEEYLVELEAAMVPLAASHGRIFWLHASRRLPLNPIGDATPWSVLLYRRILTLALLKYAAPEEGGPIFQDVESGAGRKTQVPANLTPQDVIDLHTLEYLAYEYNAAAAAFRRVGKGATLSIEHDDFRAEADPALEELLENVDSRVAKYGELTGAYGAVGDMELPSEPEEAPFFLLVPQLNVEQRGPEPLEALAGIRFPGPTNFVPAPLVLDGYRAVLTKFEKEVVELVGVEPDALLATIWALGVHLMRGLKQGPLASAQIFRTGYLIYSEPRHEELVAMVASYLESWWREVRNEPLDLDALELARATLAALTYSPDDFLKISLWDRLPFKLVTIDEGIVIIDYAALPLVISGLFRTIGFLEGDSANVKAAAFEDELVRRAADAELNIWEANRTLIPPDGRKRQIDAGIVADDTLYVVEAKAFAQNPRVDRGDFAALKGRRETLESYLNQARTLAQVLRDSPEGRNYEVPSSVKKIDYCLCTPGVEWIWTRETDLWLDATTPRICALDELIGALTTRAA